MSTFRFPDHRDNLIVMAKLAEQCERYDEMVVCMKRVVTAAADLSTDERNLLSVAYKNVIGARRASWRVISSIEAKEESKRNVPHVQLIKNYRKQVESELGEVCEDILNLLDNHLIPRASDAESLVFYNKMKGDYHRYYAEVDAGETQKEKALDAYTAATDSANALPSTSPIRLGLALNFSVFYYEILKSPDKGCALAKQAFDEAVNELDNLEEEPYKEATLIMQLLRDNLQLWQEDMEGAGADDGTKLEEFDENV